MEKIKIKKIFQKNPKEFHTTHVFPRTGNLPLYSGLPSLSVDILTLCSRSVPSSIVVTYDILSYDNGTESK